MSGGSPNQVSRAQLARPAAEKAPSWTRPGKPEKVMAARPSVAVATASTNARPMRRRGGAPPTQTPRPAAPPPPPRRPAALAVPDHHPRVIDGDTEHGGAEAE